MSPAQHHHQRPGPLECLDEGVIRPAHRQSLSRPTFISIPPRPFLGMKASPSAAQPTIVLENSSTQSLERPVEPPDHMHRSGRDDWMAKFCVEPPGDCSTCCQGIWCPCMLYSKTQYRLYQLTRGKDGRVLEKRRKCDGPCWAFCGLAVIQLSCILTAFQHTRVRSRYDVFGSLCKDCSTAIFCNSCALMQDDREVRAREGDFRLRTNPKHAPSPGIEMTESPPKQNHPMRYVSPEPEAAQSIASGIHDSDNETPNLEGLAINRLGQKMSNNNPIYFPSFPLHKGTKKDRSNSVPNKLRKQKPTKSNDRSPSLCFHHAPSTVHLDKPIRHHKIRARNYEGSRNTTPTSTPGPSRGYHKAIQAYSSGVDNRPTPDYGKQALQTRLNSFVFGSSSTMNPSDCDDESEGLYAGPHRNRHNIGDRSSVEVEGGRVRGGFQHKMAARPFISTSSATNHEHSLSQDPIIRGRTIPELSYVHDFADCPIDGNILDYIDEEERRYQQQAREQRGRSSSAAGSSSANHYLHMLADCYDAETGQQSSSEAQSRPSLRSRRLASYPTRSSKRISISLPERLVSCPPNCTRAAQNSRSRISLNQQNQAEPSRSNTKTKAKDRSRSIETSDDQHTRGRPKHSRGSWRMKNREASKTRNTWSGKRNAKHQQGLRHHGSTGQLTTLAEGPSPNEADTEAKPFLSLTHEPSQAFKKRSGIEITGGYRTRDRKSAADHAVSYGTISSRVRSAEDKNAHGLNDCVSPQPVESTAQHALAQCLAIDESRKQNQKHETPQQDGIGSDAEKSRELRHTRSEEVLTVSPLPASPEMDRPRGKSQGEIEVRRKEKGKGKSWSWWDF